MPLDTQRHVTFSEIVSFLRKFKIAPGALFDSRALLRLKCEALFKIPTINGL